MNFAEFFVTVAASVTFGATIGLSYWQMIAGLAVGGAVAAPFAAWATSRVPARPLLVLVGVLVIALIIRAGALVRATNGIARSQRLPGAASSRFGARGVIFEGTRSSKEHP